MTAHLTVTLVAHNSEDRIGAALESISDAVRSGFANAIVVDNASPDRSAEVAGAVLPEALLLRSPHNGFYAGGANLAWPHVTTPFWLLLNPDVVVPAGGLEALVAWMETHPDVGAASPLLVDAEGHSTHATARRFPRIWRALLELVRLHRPLGSRLRGRILLDPYWDGAADCLDADWVPGAALIVRREAVERAGPLAEAHGMYGEDTEWCWRIRRAGYRVGVAAAIHFAHAGESSSRRTWPAPERRARLVAGGYAASRAINGPLRARALLVLEALSLAIEARHPRRSAAERAAARGEARARVRLLSGRR